MSVSNAVYASPERPSSRLSTGGSDTGQRSIEHGGLKLRIDEEMAKLMVALQADTLASITAQQSVDYRALVTLVKEQTDALDDSLQKIQDQIAVANDDLENINHAAKKVSIMDLATMMNSMKFLRQVPSAFGVMAKMWISSEAKCMQSRDTLQQLCKMYEIESVGHLPDYIDNLRKQADELQELRKLDDDKSLRNVKRNVKNDVWDEVDRAVMTAKSEKSRRQRKDDQEDDDDISLISSISKRVFRKPVGMSENQKLAKSLKKPEPFSGTSRNEFDRYMKKFNLYTEANEMSETTKELLLEANLPTAMQSHWTFLMQEDINFEEMVQRLQATLGGTTEHAKISKQNQLFRLERRGSESYADFCSRAELIAADAFRDDYRKQLDILKTVLVGAMERDEDGSYLSALMSGLSTSKYTDLKEELLAMEKVWSDNRKRSTTEVNFQKKYPFTAERQSPSQSETSPNRRNSNQCMGCGKSDHWLKNCPNRKGPITAVAPSMKTQLQSMLSDLHQQNSIEVSSLDRESLEETDEPAFGETLKDKIQIGKHVAEGLFDPGAAATVIRSDVVTKMLEDPEGRSKIVNLKRHRGNLVGVNRNQLNILGWLLMDIETQGADAIRAVVAIVDDINHEMVIGMNVLMNQRSWWKKFVQLHKNAVKSKSKDKLKSKHIEATINSGSGTENQGDRKWNHGKLNAKSQETLGSSGGGGISRQDCRANRQNPVGSAKCANAQDRHSRDKEDKPTARGCSNGRGHRKKNDGNVEDDIWGGKGMLGFHPEFNMKSDNLRQRQRFKEKGGNIPS